MSFIAIAVGIGAVATTAATIYSADQAGKQAKRAGREKGRLQDVLKDLENKRQPIINPYSSVTDLSSMVSNPYANLGVATSAAEIQIEEADIALANTLDTLRATGSSAGGATALAQAALKSKKGVAASIEQQEAANEKLRAQGEDNLQRLQMTEAQRMQDVDVKGKTFVYSEKERRETEQLNRTQAQITGQAQAQVAAQQQQTSIISGGMSALGNLAGSYAGAMGQVEAANALNTSDRKLKKNIKFLRVSPKGLNIYAFEYINEIFGTGTWQGVMSDEIPKNAVIKNKNGYDMVDYSKLDVTFKQI